MFDKLKQIKQLKALQDSLKSEMVESENRGVKVVVNGNMQVESVKLNNDLSLSEQEKIVKDCINDAFKQVQMLVAQKMTKMQ
ncbi:MAG: hypothetical protein BWY34_00148 [Parcubacteria group bacterium ADurb.Bin247]|jgi:DNA-binding protein YbaB|nr:MAG: hypothetical protein BWY34_00148 [Parcubacteria group bacterium ADurb.Bin247]HQB85163.1 YbaB/EbfC family nucleoid-associated protein [Candidatus Pacearchaeota archaeon]